ncbi:hypothetical protein OROHE_000252 [Orobanche hederae]
MASSHTTSFTKKKNESIIDGRHFVQSVVMERIQTENNDVAAMEHVVSRIKQTGLFNLGRQHSDLYDESLVEEFYQEASVRFRSVKKGGDVAEISATIYGVEILINRHLLEDLFYRPLSGLKMEELESFGSEDLLSSFWCVFIGDITDKKVHPLCHKKRFTLPFVYLHDFCYRVVENRTGAFEMCTNLRFRVMVAIMFGEPANWCQIIMKSIQEEVYKPLSQKKLFGLLLNNIVSCLDVPFAMNANKIGPGKPSVFALPKSANLRDVTKKSKAVSSKKRKHSLSDKKSQPAVPEKKKKKVKKAHKPKPTEVTATPVNQLLANVEGTGESTAFPELVVTAPVRVSTPVQDPSPHKEPSPVRDPSPLRTLTPVRIPTSEQASIPVTDPKPPELSTDISLLTRWKKSFCHELITNLCIAQAEARLKGKTKSVDHAPSSPTDDSDDDDDTFQAGLRMSREEAQESEIRSALASQGQGTSKDHSSPKQQEEDAVNALHKVGKALDKLNVSTAKEIRGVTSDLFIINNALQVLPPLLKVALANIQQQKKEILEKEEAKYSTFAARTAIALKASVTKLTGRDKNLDDLSLSLQTLSDKFNNIKGKQDDVMDLVHSIKSHISEIIARKGEEESREAARRWRLQKEAELNDEFDDSISAAINQLGVPRRGYLVSGHRPEHHDLSVPWKQLVQAPAEIHLPTDRQPSPEDIKQWNKNELMGYFVKLIWESIIFDRCKTLSEAANEFTARLEKGGLPLQLAMLSKHKKGDRITHLEDWILSYDKSYEGMAIYQNRSQDALVNWWKDTEFDPRKQRPWRHEHQFSK